MLSSIPFSQSIIQILEEKAPHNLIKSRKGAGGKDLSYVSGNYVIDVLNRAFGYAWDWKVEKCWIEHCIPWTKKGYQGKPDETKTEENSVAHVLGTLTVYLREEDGTVREIKKSGLGSKSIIGNQSEQESIYKAAQTDAIKKAASLLGIMASLYRDDAEQNYFDITFASSYWKEEDYNNYKEEFELLESFGWPEEYMDQLIAGWSEGRYNSLKALTPKVFGQFMDYIHEEMKRQQE